MRAERLVNRHESYLYKNPKRSFHSNPDSNTPLLLHQTPNSPSLSHTRHRTSSVSLVLHGTSVAALVAGGLASGSRGLSGAGGGRGSRGLSSLDGGGGGTGGRSSSSISGGRGRAGDSGGSGRSRGGGGVGAAGAGAGVAAEGQRGAGDGVRGEVGVQVEQDALLVGGVERGAEGAVGQLGAGARDLQVDAHGVVLGAVRVLGRVQRDDLVAQHVVARLEGRRDGDVVGEVVGDQVVGCPHARVGAGDEARRVDLDPGEGRLVDGGGVVGGRDVVDDGAVVLRCVC